MTILSQLPGLRCRTIRLILTAFVAAAVTAGCGSPDQRDQAQGFVQDGNEVGVQSAGSDTQPEVDGSTASADDSSGVPQAPLRVTADTLSDRVVDLGPADGIPEVPVAGPQPVSVSIDRIGVEAATVLGVGIEPNGEMEVPPPLQVGWYEYGPSPGETGSAVLAGHIASNGIDGAFRYLDRVEVGDTIEVGYDNGSVSRFQVTDLVQYDKYSLPFDDVFAEEGEPQLVLITCGGDFDSAARSYEDNVVVYADPVEA